MKKLSKILFSIIMVFLVAFSFTACNDNKNNDDNQPPTEIENSSGGEQGNPSGDDNKGDEKDPNNGDDDNKGDEEDPNENPETPKYDDGIIVTALSAQELLNELSKLNCSFSNYYSVKILDTDERIGRTRDYSELVNVVLGTDDDGNTTKEFKIELSQYDKVIGYYLETLTVMPNATNVFSNGISIDESNKYYSYVSSFDTLENGEEGFSTYLQYILIKYTLATYGNESIFDASFINTYENIFANFANGAYISKTTVENDVLYRIEFKNEYSRCSKFIYKFTDGKLQNLSINLEMTNRIIDLVYAPEDETKLVELPDITNDPYIQEADKTVV